MHRRTSFILAFVASVGLAAIVLHSSHSCDCRLTQGDDTFIAVREQYSIVLPRAELLAEHFGTDWPSLHLYYACFRAQTNEGPAAILSGFKLLGRPQPALFVSGVQWDRVPCVLYCTETRVQIAIAVDFKSGTIQVEQGPEIRHGTAQSAPDGTLFFLD